MAPDSDDAAKPANRVDPGASANSADESLTSTIELLNRLKQGDERARDLLVERSLPVLKRWAHGRLPVGSRGVLDTQDLVHNAVLRALPRLQTFEARHPGALQSYLRQAISSAVLDEVYKTRRRPPAALSKDLVDPSSSPIEQAIGRDQLARYEAALQRLEPADREAIIARLELQQTYGEIAVALDKPSADAARMCVARAMTRLVHAMRPGAELHSASKAHAFEGSEPFHAASAIADAESIDWERFERRPVHGNRRETVDSLKTLLALSEENRSRIHGHPGRHDTGRDESAGDVHTWGRFILRRKIAQGAFGDVYEALDPSSGERIAVKLFRPAVAEAFASGRVRVAQRLEHLRHPNVVAIREAAVHEGRAGVSMEFVEGQTLSEYVAAHGRLGAAEAAAAGDSVCGALAAVHDAGLVHRDVKAQNVIRCADGRIVLTDFGSTELLDTPTLESQPQGTPLYLAPELFEGRPASVASDIYSVGVLLYYLVTGRYPVEAKSVEGVVDAHRRGERRRLANDRPDLPSAFVTVVERALEQDPARRYSSAAEMLQALHEATQVASASLELSAQAQAMVTRLSARAYFLAQGELLRSSRSRAEALAMFTNRAGATTASMPTQLIAHTLAALANQVQLAEALAESAVASFACELERGLLREHRCRFDGIGEFTLTSNDTSVDVGFTPEPPPSDARAREQEDADTLPAHALREGAAAVPGPLVSVTASITERIFAGQGALFSQVGVQGLGRAVYWAFVAAIHCNVKGVQRTSLPHVGSFELRGDEMTFQPDPSFVRILAMNT